MRLELPCELTDHLCVHTVTFISREGVAKTWAGTQTSRFLLHDSQFSLPVFPGPLSEVGLMTLFSWISFLLFAGMKREKKATDDIAGHGINTSSEPAAAPSHLFEQRQQHRVRVFQLPQHRRVRMARCHSALMSQGSAAATTVLAGAGDSPVCPVLRVQVPAPGGAATCRLSSGL